MSALKALIGKGLGAARDDESDGPKPASIGAAFMKRMFKHMQAGDFEKAFECLEKANGVAGGDDDEPDDAATDEGDADPSYS